MMSLQTRPEKILFGSLVLALCTAVLPLTQALADLSHSAAPIVAPKPVPSCATGFTMTNSAAGFVCTSNHLSCPAGYTAASSVVAPTANKPAKISYACTLERNLPK